MNFDKGPKLDYKCANCGKGKSRHNAVDLYCPIGSGQYPSFHRTQVFMGTSNLTIKSKRDLAKHVAEVNRREELRLAQEREMAKVRAMTYEEVITKTAELIWEYTGLCIEVERERDWQATIHITNIGGSVRLGYTTVTKAHTGGYLVGGTSAGCCMSSHDDKCFSVIMAPHFRALEDAANQEKV